MSLSRHEETGRYCGYGYGPTCPCPDTKKRVGIAGMDLHVLVQIRRNGWVYSEYSGCRISCPDTKEQVGNVGMDLYVLVQIRRNG